MTNLQTVRTFIATIPEPETTKRLIAAYQPIKTGKFAKGIRWIDEANLHVTLRFLGNLSPEQLQQLPSVLTEKLHGYRPCTLIFDRMVWFPSERRPRVVAANFKSSPEFHAIALRAEMAARAIGVTANRRAFRPHLSLGILPSKDLPPCTLEQPIDNLEMPVEELIVFSSELTPQGPIYRELYCVSLKP